MFSFKSNKELRLREEISRYAQALSLTDKAVSVDIITEIDFPVWDEEHKNNSGKSAYLIKNIIIFNQYGLDRVGDHQKIEFLLLEDFFKHLSMSSEQFVYIKILHDTCQKNNVQINGSEQYVGLMNDVRDYVQGEFNKKRLIYFSSKGFQNLKKTLKF